MRTRSSSSSNRLWLAASLLGASACVRAARSDGPASTLPGSPGLLLTGAFESRWRGCAATPSTGHGGDVSLVHPPDLGIRGNTHFMFSDLNNPQIADLLSSFLAQKHLD